MEHLLGGGGGMAASATNPRFVSVVQRGHRPAVAAMELGAPPLGIERPFWKRPQGNGHMGRRVRGGLRAQWTGGGGAGKLQDPAGGVGLLERG